MDVTVLEDKLIGEDPEDRDSWAATAGPRSAEATSSTT